MLYVLSRETVGSLWPLVGSGMAFPECDMALDFSIGGGYLALANSSIIRVQFSEVQTRSITDCTCIALAMTWEQSHSKSLYLDMAYHSYQSLLSLFPAQHPFPSQLVQTLYAYCLAME